MTGERMQNQDIPQGRGRHRRLLEALAAVLVVGVGIVAAVLVIKLRKPPEHVEQETPVPLVEVQRLKAGSIPMMVRGHGAVTPRVSVDIIPEVAGKAVYVHSELKAGGMIPAHEPILRIDPTDYELAVRQARAAVAEAQVRLDMEVAEAEVARREWRQLNPQTEPDSPLVLREPQIRRAQTALESANAQLATAELRLQRTTISLPFDVLVADERVDLGQFVAAGQSLATVYGTDVFEIRVPLNDAELAWFDAFDASGTSDGATAEVRVDFAGGAHAWPGRVARTTRQVDPATRMVPVVVEVSRPLEASAEKPPLLPGAFVEVLIAGRTLDNAVAVPREAIRGGDRVWLVQDGRIHIEELDIVRADEQYAYVASASLDGALVVASALDAVVEGMRVRVGAGVAEQGEPQGVSDSPGKER